MITEENLPSHIKEVVFQYKQPGEKFEVFPSLIVVDGKRYYAIVYSSSKKLIICESGEVLPLNKVIKPALIVPAVLAVANSIKNFGVKWKNSYSVKSLRRLERILGYFKQKYRKKAPIDVQQAIEAFYEIPNTLLEHQRIIAKCVDEAINIIDDSSNREIFTEEDYYRLRKCKNDMVRSAYWQNEIQLRTEKDRTIVLDYLVSNIFLFNLMDWLRYGYIKFHDIRMLSESKFPEEARETKELADLIFKEVPLEEDEEAPEILKEYRNPK